MVAEMEVSRESLHLQRSGPDEINEYFGVSEKRLFLPLKMLGSQTNQLLASCASESSYTQRSQNVYSAFMPNGRHGLTNKQIYQLAEAQGFECPLSGKKLIVRGGEVFDPTTKKRIAIDHCHKTGYIRGLLIQKVNWLVDQWEQNSYGKLSMPPEIIAYKNNPPAFAVLGKIKYI